MLIRRYLLPALMSLLVVVTSNSVVAQSRYGVLQPEDLQKQSALAAAPSGADKPLVDSEVQLPKDALVSVALDQPSELEKTVAQKLEPVTLEERIQDQTVQPKLEQFGYDIFSAIPSTFAPVMGIPVPEDYVIGPGDSFKVQVFSVTDVEYNLVVTREGRLLVPEVGDIQVAGLTFKEAKTVLGESLNRIRVGAKTVVTLSELHTIQVLMVGEVAQPGSYTVSGLSSLLNTLIATGGISRTGSLRDIQVKRGGAVIARFDLYELLLKGVETGNVYLRQGDIVFVPPIGKTAGVAGEVHRPAIYELSKENTVAQLISLAGGLLPTAAKSKTQIERIAGDNGYTLVQVDLSNGSNAAVENGDLIRVLPVVEKMDNVVLLNGHVITPGGYQWRPEMRVSDLITSKKMLLQGTDFSIAAIERENVESKRTEIRYFSLEEALQSRNSDQNAVLMPRDRVIVFNTHTARADQLASIVNKMRNEATAAQPAPIVELYGFVKHGGAYPIESTTRVLDLIEYAGGLKSGTDNHYAVLARTIRPSGLVDITALSFESFNRGLTSHNPILNAGDRLYLFGPESDRPAILKDEVKRLREQVGFGELAPIIEVGGAVAKPGAYPMTAGMRINDLIIAAGGMTESAYGLTATLSRRSLLNGEFSKIDRFDIALTSNSALVESGDSILQPYDSLVLHQKPEWINKPKRITIEGEVLYPGTFEVDKRETLCGVVQQAGGFTEDAYLFGTVFLRESVRKKEQEALDKILAEMDDLLAEVHLSPGYEKDQKMPVNQGTNDTFQVIKQLAPKQARGRLVIDMDAAVANCNETADLVLEDGDRIIIPKYQDEVSVVGQVYFPTSHKFRSDRAALDYINLSGGTKELAQREHAYIVQANGEVMTVRSKASTWGWLMSPANVEVTPGATVYVPLSVDRINGREFTQSWVDIFYKLALSTASVDYLFK
ncbi:Polysialic acid transport protein KpsD precursor [Marinobacterium sp. xm-m-312]|nr:Polysialic acid transport protein KpsD precursor [Marinobacterium sp. xm-d-543]NRQ23474.1 Polysialic acid transport protein KpsD precursor [Marinobacterium sp. xm-m-312]